MHLLQSVENFREPFILKIVELLTNLVDHTNEAVRRAPIAASLGQLLTKHRHNNAVYILGQPEHLAVLLGLLQRLLTDDGYRQTDKELRNDVLVLCCKLADRASHHAAFVATGFTEFLLTCVPSN